MRTSSKRVVCVRTTSNACAGVMRPCRAKVLRRNSPTNVAIRLYRHAPTGTNWVFVGLR